MEFNFAANHYEFINKEFGVAKEALSAMDGNDLDSLYEKVCGIEISETIAAGSNDLSPRGEIAVEIVNVMAENLGYVQEEDEEEEEKPEPKKAAA